MQRRLIHNMRIKKEQAVLSFATTTQAMAAEKYFQEQGIPGRLIPLPGEISADCGLAWAGEPEQEPQFKELVEKGKIKIQGIHRVYLMVQNSSKEKV